MKIKTYIIYALTIILSSCNFSNSDLAFGDVNQNKSKNYSLLVAEFDKNSSIGDFTHLVSYTLTNGVVTSIDTLMSEPMSYIHYGFGGNDNFVFQNRYIITALGNVIDLKTNEVIKEEMDPFVYSKGDILVFDTDYNLNKKSFTKFNVKTGEYTKVIDNFFTTKRILHSPDNNNKLVLKDFSKNIIIKPRRERPYEIVKFSGFGTPLNMYSGQFPETPTIWYDSENLIYTKFTTDAEIRIVNILNKTDSLIATIDSIPQSGGNAYFYKDSRGSIIFSCSKGDYKVNVKNNVIEDYEFYLLNHDFSIRTWWDSFGKEIRFKNQKIGKIWCSTIKETTGHIAVVYGHAGSNLGYPKGVKIWSIESRKWITIDIPWICSIVGWYEN